MSDGEKQAIMTIEKKLFTWADWDDFGDGASYFYNVVLAIPIGIFPAGVEFDGCLVDHLKSRIVFQKWSSDDPQTVTEYGYELSYSVGPQIDLSST
jgi:hypothetical protein